MFTSPRNIQLYKRLPLSNPLWPRSENPHQIPIPTSPERRPPATRLHLLFSSRQNPTGRHFFSGSALLSRARFRFGQCRSIEVVQSAKQEVLQFHATYEMKAVQFHGKGDIRLNEVAIPPVGLCIRATASERMKSCSLAGFDPRSDHFRCTTLRCAACDREQPPYLPYAYSDPKTQRTSQLGLLNVLFSLRRLCSVLLHCMLACQAQLQPMELRCAGFTVELQRHRILRHNYRCTVHANERIPEIHYALSLPLCFGLVIARCAAAYKCVVQLKSRLPPRKPAFLRPPKQGLNDSFSFRKE